MELMSRIDFTSLTGRYSSSLNLTFFIDLNSIRAHIETAFHKKIARRLRELRNDTIWINGEDVSMAFKPMKMGLRIANLVEPWQLFESKYLRVKSTFSELYRVEFTDEEMKEDLDMLKNLHSKLLEHKMVSDTVTMLN